MRQTVALPTDYPRDFQFLDPQVRARAHGKFFFIGGQKFYVRGVTYGAFQPNAEGREYHDLTKIDDDFAQMSANGINSVRIPHTMPPVELLDIALRHGLKVMVGLSAEQYVGYLIDREKGRDITGMTRQKVRAVSGHPAILCYGLGNEISASVTRWLGARKVEGYLQRLYYAVKEEDPEGVVTYVNYPTTEYLQLPFLDALAFNVYLEQKDRLEAYLARLQHLAGDRPLLMSEVGLDAMRNGQIRQAEALDWQIRTVFKSGCAGAFVFSWTDEWCRAGEQVEDWAFGITDRERRPKLALEAVHNAYSEVPVSIDPDWPRISVVICTYNGSRTLGDTLRALSEVAYPSFEVIVIDDGSTDDIGALVNKSGYRLIRTENGGLSRARNLGLAAASGEIVAYLDDDAYPDPNWLTYLALAFRDSDHAGIGGPNIPPPDDGWIADCVAHSPGGPVHVLLTDQIAEHIPGCNMAFRKKALDAIGGFDPQFRVAGDDVDLCWQLQKRGWTIGFSPAAVVWHHRRNSIRAYWKQQKGYGKAEALLERKWPTKYNAAGHVMWGGRVYTNGLFQSFGWGSGRIYHGSWGAAPFQSLYQPAAGVLVSLTMMPEWYLIILALGALSLAGIFSTRLLVMVPFLLLAVLAPLIQAVHCAIRARSTTASLSRAKRLRFRAVTAFLHLMQPLARLSGRIRWGLTPLRLRRTRPVVFPRPMTLSIWREDWRPAEQHLESMEKSLRDQSIMVRRGGDYDRWDLEVMGGVLGSAHLLLGVEDHGGGCQYLRVRCRPRSSPLAGTAIALFAAVAIFCSPGVAAIALGALALLLILEVARECSVAMSALVKALPENGSAVKESAEAQACSANLP